MTPKAQAKEKGKKKYIIKIKNPVLEGHYQEREKNGRKCLQIMYVIRDVCLEHIKESYNT